MPIIIVVAKWRTIGIHVKAIRQVFRHVQGKYKKDANGDECLVEISAVGRGLGWHRPARRVSTWCQCQHHGAPILHDDAWWTRELSWPSLTNQLIHYHYNEQWWLSDYFRTHGESRWLCSRAILMGRGDACCRRETTTFQYWLYANLRRQKSMTSGSWKAKKTEKQGPNLTMDITFIVLW
jgi:hypothetical protein